MSGEKSGVQIRLRAHSPSTRFRFSWSQHDVWRKEWSTD